MNLSTWMTDIYETIKSKPINNIIMPATHDSGSYKFDFSNSFMWDSNIVNIVKPFRNILCVKNMVINWSRCHYDTIYEQLCNGIRIFDLRASYDIANKIFYVTHTFTCVNMTEIFNDIIKFLSQNTKEIIIIYCKPDWENRYTMYNASDDFLNYIETHLGKYLYDNIGSFPTYEQMIDVNKRVIFTYEDASNTLVWDSVLFNLPWTNTSVVSQKLIGLQNSLNSFQPSFCNVLDFTLTPQTNNIVASAFSCGCYCACTSLHGLAERINNQLDQFTSKNKDHFDNLSGFFFDFPDSDMIKTIIKLNIKK